MRVMRPPTLLLILVTLLFANAFSKPLYVPEHCQSYTGKLLQACIRSAKIDTSGIHNRVIAIPTSTGSVELSLDRGAQSDHDVYYDESRATTVLITDLIQN
uniref:ORF3 protein n=2 Tax=unclassified Orthocoronavirinae TaxID=2730119 RepID=A0AA49IEW2_9NIDO|nr:ORF3 protein [Bat Coronavirus HlHI19]WCC62950.1 ORF3 protein [Bat Coronavirus TpGX16]